MTEWGHLSETSVYAYDLLNRLTEAKLGGITAETITYHPTNGIIRSKDGVLHGYDVNHPHAVTRLDSVQKYSHDATGRWRGMGDSLAAISASQSSAFRLRS
ncbi:MAG: hypothetical protein BGO78_14170 [Chloroflexi bacterium 44-23]|nr:MAG: hypothetical protein BGO78_14170 [Chloroflexi bacterium 44-23]